MAVQLNVRINYDLRDQLRIAAIKANTSIQYIVTEAIIEKLEQLKAEEQKRDEQHGIDRSSISSPSISQG